MTTILDSVNGHNAADGNTDVPCQIVVGKVNDAVQFNGEESAETFPYLSISHGAEFLSSTFTVSCWIRLHNNTESQYWIIKGGSDLILSFDSIGNRLVAMTSGDLVPAETFGAPPVDQWLFVVIKKSSDTTTSIQVNGGTADTGNAGTAIGTDAISIFTSQISSLGHAIDDLRFFTDALSSGEITTLYNSGAGTANAIGDEIHWWTFNSLIGGVYPDSAGDSDATPHGSLISSVAGVVGSGISATSILPYNWLQVEDAADLQAYGMQSFTFCFWLKLLGYPVESRAAFFFKTDAGDADYQIDLYSDGTLGFYIAGSDSAYPETDLATLPLNEWMLITATHKAGVGLSLQKNLETPVSADYTLGNMALNSPEPLICGRKLNGIIDELGFWKRVLTSDEIAYLYNSGAGRALFPAP